MTRLKLLTATALAASLIAAPAMARQTKPLAASHHHRDYRADRGFDYRADRGFERHDSGFWPADVAAGIVGGAIGTAGAIATAPFRNDSYAYYNDGYYNNGYGSYAYDTGPGYGPNYDNNYARLNGFVCTPGTWFRGEDGRQHLCQ
jgi:hypothetical protein